jgi:hypothetical protein
MHEINMAGSYKVHLQVTDKKAYRDSHDGANPTFTARTVERWFNTTDEKDDLFDRWQKMGIEADVGRYLGRD